MRANNKIKDRQFFLTGIGILLFSLLPFLYMNHSEKYKIENCYKIEGIVNDFTKSYSKHRTQDGWMIHLSNSDYKIRVVGEYYNALDHQLFDLYVKKDNKLAVYILRPETNGIFEKLNENLGIKDAAIIKFQEHEILSLEKIKENLSHLFIMNLSFGIVAAGCGLYLIYKSTQ